MTMIGIKLRMMYLKYENGNIQILMNASSKKPDRILLLMEWYPLADRPKVSDEIVYLYAICQQMAFRKLDDYRQEDDTETEFGYLCRICLRVAEKTKERYCPFCGRKLFAFPIDNYY